MRCRRRRRRRRRRLAQTLSRDSTQTPADCSSLPPLLKEGALPLREPRRRRCRTAAQAGLELGDLVAELQGARARFVRARGLGLPDGELAAFVGEDRREVGVLERALRVLSAHALQALLGLLDLLVAPRVGEVERRRAAGEEKEQRVAPADVPAEELALGVPDAFVVPGALRDRLDLLAVNSGSGFAATLVGGVVVFGGRPGSSEGGGDVLVGGVVVVPGDWWCAGGLCEDDESAPPRKRAAWSRRAVVLATTAVAGRPVARAATEMRGPRPARAAAREIIASWSSSSDWAPGRLGRRAARVQQRLLPLDSSGSEL
eukprot:CAMPEP_0185689896 /NCGR_PEP_ID=MMETSP1164-20130828/759_1 /TAXON_ID=1104430 /ORGANISM="Chrysoreinhardia sp, Strain CCMP2950" /LENGTH=315 /DNA_ID=CAMNT_0028356429 /DNA_START=182 /DNA_END=1127 /DNA_ORIENTATION=-